MDFEAVIKTIVVTSFALILPVGGYVAVRMAMVWIRGHEREAALRAGEPADDQAQARIAQLEAEVVELHERLDFTERMLAQARQPERLP